MSPSDGRQWHVLLTNDEVNSHAGMVYVLHRACGMSPDADLAVPVADFARPGGEFAPTVTKLASWGRHC